MEINATIPEAKVLAINPPPITGMSITGGFEGYLQSRTGESAVQVAEVANRLVAAASPRPGLTGVPAALPTNVPRSPIELDRAKARALQGPIHALSPTRQGPLATSERR